MEYPQHLDHRFNPIGNNRPLPKVQRADARCDVVARGAAVGVRGEVGRMGFDGTGVGEGRVGIGAGGDPVVEAGEVVDGGPAPDDADFCRQAPWPFSFAWRAARPLRTSSAGWTGRGSARASATRALSRSSSNASSRSSARRPARTTSLTEAVRPDLTRSRAAAVSGLSEPRVPIAGEENSPFQNYPNRLRMAPFHSR